MAGAVWDTQDLREAKADTWLDRAKASTEETLRGWGWSGGTSQPASEQQPTLAIPSMFTQSDDEYRAAAPWRDLDPTPEPSRTSQISAPTGGAGTQSAPAQPVSTATVAGDSGGVTAAPSGAARVAAQPSGPPSEGVLRWASLVDKAAAKYGVPREHLFGLMDIESGGRTHDAQGRPLRSSAGATSLMQVMPFHFQAGEDPDDPETNIMKGAKIFADNYRRYGDYDRAAAAYFGAIDQNGNITDATDGSDVTGSKYVRLFRGASAKYGPGSQTHIGPAGPPAQRVDPAGQQLTPGGQQPPAVPQTFPERSGDDVVTIQHVDDGRTQTVPRADLPGWLKDVYPGSGPLWRVVGPQASAALPPRVAQQFRAATGADASPEDLEQLRMLGLA